MKLKLKKSLIGQNQRIRSTLTALKLKKPNKISQINETPSTLGMLKKVSHMVERLDK